MISEEKVIDRIGFIASFQNELVKAEAKHIRKFKAYFKKEYFKGVDDFVSTRSVHSYPYLFKVSEIEDMYVSMYVDISKRFYKWYEKNFESFVEKREYDFILNAKFAEFAKRAAGDKISLVSGSKKRKLIKVLKTMFRNPDYQFMNERELQKVLRSKFSSYSKFQAERLVRTEANTAANYGSVETANAMFGKQGYVKEWLTANDERVRSPHASANGQIVSSDSMFLVMGEKLKFPGDPSASAANRINCRCQSLCYPPDVSLRSDVDTTSQIPNLITTLPYLIDEE